MRTRLAVACAMLLAIGTPAAAHRLDEYLQATTISLERGHVQAQMRLTPGVAVLPAVLAGIDTNRDGVISAAEQRAYAEKVLRDLSLAVDGNSVQLRLVSWKFAPLAEMKEGRGDIQLDLTADLPGIGSHRRLLFQNRHQSRIAAYLVNCLVPSDPAIQVTGQKRNYRQSSYELDFAEADVASNPAHVVWRPGAPIWSGIAALVLLGQLGLVWQRARASKVAQAQSGRDATHGAAFPEGRSV
jgi:hypothetical protein